MAAGNDEQDLVNQIALIIKRHFVVFVQVTAPEFG